MHSTDIPAVSDLTPAWFTAVLRDSGTLAATSNVTEVQLDRIGDDESMMSALYLASLTCDTAGEAPDRVVVKLASTSEEMRMTAALFRFYDREVLFYDRFAHTVDARIPGHHLARMHPEEPQFVIVMEDIGGGRQVDQITGLDLPDTMAAMDAIADFQAPNWGADLSAHADTMIPFDSEPLHMLIPDNFANGWQRTKPKLTDEIAPEVVEMCDRFGEICPQILEAMNGPDTVIHGDYRAENLSFDSEGILLFDFQLACIAHGAVDVGYCLSQSVRSDVLSEHGDALLERYIDRLAGHGIDLGIDDARRACQASMIFHLQIPFQVLSADGLPDRAEQLARTMLRRASTEIVRTGAHLRFS